MIVLLGFDWVKGFLDGQRKTATIVMIAETDHRSAWLAACLNIRVVVEANEG